ncbi:bifunctional 4-hydroxy-2-oxoglutarate aldolase/2-dehydro-3-deoxy-phosphogluconate aldolase [Streptomyces odontomachi]|uniref:bifunctional 4-hydroxy-2-oxoglutarate aldolase/2-dehydro-3-deoxy-phosphogluconate aldolase n=1 Tax=Streptomyces odontomachi TaxID=2944940 RepID=UPI00210A8FA3|nr:bifunctional 4-hydroxy-2-oxoglutarate aldolase/2-dehydro-3-deoxy-phosphogluconate aldolase [Streptomyces sp. ODS25]
MNRPDLPEVVAILRGLAPERAVPAVGALVDAGIRAFEITMNSPGALTSIERLAARYGADVRVGAGTVRSVDQVGQVAAAGGTFALSPHTDTGIIAACRESGLLSVPGAFTPTEIEHAWRSGADVVKVFPVQPAGPGYLRAVRDPLDDVPLLACGGLTAEVGRECLAAGCVSLGVGLGLFDADAVGRDDWAALGRSAAGYLEALGPRRP